jgi:hypothetical protein
MFSMLKGFVVPLRTDRSEISSAFTTFAERNVVIKKTFLSFITVFRFWEQSSRGLAAATKKCESGESGKKGGGRLRDDGAAKLDLCQAGTVRIGVRVSVKGPHLDEGD